MSTGKITIQPKVSGSKKYGKAVGAEADLAKLARQFHTLVKPACGLNCAHLDLTQHQVKLAIRSGASIQGEA